MTQVACVPHHIAIIPDGNRRWSRREGLSEFEGHAQGVEVLINTMRAAKDLGVRVITFYSFSTENWRRSPVEVEGLMTLLVLMLEREVENMVEDGVRFRTIGDLSPFSDLVKETIERTKRATEDQEVIDLVLALNYGGRDELRRSVQKILEEVECGKVAKEEVTEEVIASHLDTSPWGDPDCIIRTGGEARLSNFMLWQASYAEWILMDIYWPEFTREHLAQACENFNSRERRWGGGK